MGNKITNIERNTPARIIVGIPTAINIEKVNLRIETDIPIPPFTFYDEPSAIKSVKRDLPGILRMHKTAKPRVHIRGVLTLFQSGYFVLSYFVSLFILVFFSSYRSLLPALQTKVAGLLSTQPSAARRQSAVDLRFPILQDLLF